MKCFGMAALLAVGAAVAAAQSPAPAKIADEWNDRGLAASARGEYAEAERDLGESVRLWRTMGPEFDGHTATVMMNLAEALCGENKWSDGARLLAESLEMNRRALGNHHIRTVSNMNFLASAGLILGDWDKSLALYQEALAIERESFPNTTELADTLMGLSSYYVRQGHVTEALLPAEEGLKVSLAAGGENTIDAAMAYANVAQIHTFQHHPERAIPLYRKAEAIYAVVLSPKHPRYASVLSQEGLALMQDHKLALADRNMSRAVEILSQTSGAQYQEAVAQSNLGWLRFQEGKYQDADEHLSKALALQESYSAHAGSEMAATLNRLSEVRRKERRYSDADQLHTRALTLSTYR
jgi:tetratricopeptide (TPR) repeat protein